MSYGNEDGVPSNGYPPVGQYRGSATRYDDANCATQQCPYVLVTELSYERQIDEPDGPYHRRLRERLDTARSHGNIQEMAAIYSALQIDIGIPEDGLHVPCRDENEWLVLAYIQNVKPEAWLYAERMVHDADEDRWYTPGPSVEGFTLWKELRSIFDPAGSRIGSVTFLGPDGIEYSLLGANPEIGDYFAYQNRSLVALLKEIARELGVNPFERLQGVDEEDFGYQTTDPQLVPIRSVIFEYEVFQPSGEVDHGENILLAQGPTRNDAINGNISGAFGQPSSGPKSNVGSNIARTWRIIVHNGRGGPFVNLYRQGLDAVLGREGLSRPQFLQLRNTNPARYRDIRNRAMQSARLRIPGVRADMRRDTTRGEQIVTQQGGTPNFRTFRSKDRHGNAIYVKPDGFGRTGNVQEVKLVRYQANTQQIQAEMRLATDRGVDFELIIQHRTVLSAPLDRMRKLGALIVRRE